MMAGPALFLSADLSFFGPALKEARYPGMKRDRADVSPWTREIENKSVN